MSNIMNAVTALQQKHKEQSNVISAKSNKYGELDDYDKQNLQNKLDRIKKHINSMEVSFWTQPIINMIYNDIFKEEDPNYEVNYDYRY